MRMTSGHRALLPSAPLSLRRLLLAGACGALLLAGAVVSAPAARADDLAQLTRSLLASETKPTDRALIAARLQGQVQGGKQVLVKALAEHRDKPYVLQAVLASLKQQPDPYFLEALLDLYAAPGTGDLGGELRGALTALQQRQPIVHRAIAGRIADKARPAAVRQRGARLLGELRAWRQIGALLAARAQDPEVLGPAVQQALRAITQLEYGDDLVRWKALWKSIEGKSGEEAHRLMLDAHVAWRRDRESRLSEEVKRYLAPTDRQQNLLALDSQLAGVRAAAVDHLTALGRDSKQRKACVEALLARLPKERAPEVLARLVRSYAELQLEPAERDQVRPVLLGLLARIEAQAPEDAGRQLVALQLARTYGVLKIAGAVQPLRVILGRPWATDEIKLETVRALGRLGGDEALAALTGLVRPRTSPTLLGAVAEMLGGFPKAARTLLGLVSHEQPDVRSRAADALGKLGAKLPAELAQSAAEALASRLASREERAYVRASAALALGELAQPKALKALTDALTSDPDALVRQRAAEGLGSQAKAETLPALERALSDTAPDVRKASWTAFQAVIGKDPKALLPHAERWFAAEQLPDYARQVFEQQLASLPKEQVKPRAALTRKIARCRLLSGEGAAALAALEPLQQAAPADRELALWLAEAVLLAAARPALPAARARAAKLLERFDDKPASPLAWRASRLRVELELASDPKAARARLTRLKTHDAKLGGDAEGWAALEAKVDKALAPPPKPPKPGPKPQPKPGPKPEPKPQPKRGPKPEPKPDQPEKSGGDAPAPDFRSQGSAAD